MTATIEIHVPLNKKRERIDKFLTRQISDVSRSQIKKIINSNEVLVNGKPVRPSHEIDPGELILVTIPAPEPFEMEPQDIPLNVVHEDEYILLVDKPPGMVVHPARGNLKDTLVNALLHYSNSLSGSTDPFRPGIVHRLDKGTSGLLVVAKSDRVHSSLTRQFMDRTVKKEYTALVWGVMRCVRGELSEPIGRHKHDRKKMVASPKGKAAVTSYSVSERWDFITRLRLFPLTGRTHQIRVHLAHAGYPIFGDPDYGGRSKKTGMLSSPERATVAKALKMIDHQALHAEKITFRHPASDEIVTFESAPPEEFVEVMKIFSAYHAKGG